MKTTLPRQLAAGAILSSFLMMGSTHAQTAGGDDLLKMEKNAANVVMPTITYDNQRYSTLDQIKASNVGKLQVAWTFSTASLSWNSYFSVRSSVSVTLSRICQLSWRNPPMVVVVVWAT